MYGFVCTPTITKSRRIHPNSAALIYNIFTTSNKIYTSGIILADISDHVLIYTVEDISTKLNYKVVKRPDISDKNTLAFCNSLKNEDWDLLMTEQSSLKDCNLTADKHDPLKSVKLKID